MKKYETNKKPAPVADLLLRSGRFLILPISATQPRGQSVKKTACAVKKAHCSFAAAVRFVS